MFEISSLLVNGIPLIAVIFGLVEFAKSLGLKGNWLAVFSLFLGLLFGLAYRFAMDGIPISFTTWFSAILFGLVIGLTASGFYNFINERLPRQS